MATIGVDMNAEGRVMRGVQWIFTTTLAVGLLEGCAKDRFGEQDGDVESGMDGDPSTATPSLQPEMGARSGVEPAAGTGEAPSIGAEPPDECPDGGGCSTACSSEGNACDPACPGCSIDGLCAAAGELARDNACLVCDPTRDAAGWSPNDGTTCDDQTFCTIDDACVEGVCQGSPRPCEDGIVCNGTSSCDEATATCSPPENLCGQGAVCDTSLDGCVTTCLGCVINGNCIADASEQAGNPCMVCDIARSTTAFVAAVGKSCGAGATGCSQQDACDGAGLCQPNHVEQGTPCGDATVSACNGADSCDGVGNCLPQLSANGAPCDDGQFCTINDQCQGGECVTNPRGCGVGLSCNEAANACQCAGCQIDGACLAANAVSSSNPCQVCDPARSNTSFSASLDPLCPAANLVAYYAFNGDARDGSGRGHDCVVTGAVLSVDRLGRPNRAFRFDGVDDSMSCGGDSPELEITGALSIAAWFSADAASLAESNRNLISKGLFSGGGATRAYALVLQNQDQSEAGSCGPTHSPTFLVSEDGLQSPPSGRACGATAIQPNTWHHAVGVFQPNALVALYIDGALAVETTTGVASQLFNTSQALRIGVNGTNFYQGSLDEVRIYNRALNQAEVTALRAGTQ
jgi:hypothetical protein